MRPNLSLYILCGGKSSRMGQEKGLVEFHGKSFVQWILEAVYPLVPNPVLVTSNTDYEQFQLEMISDLVENKGPMGGIYTALSHSTSELVLILSCDIPKITSEVLSFLIEISEVEPEKITFLSEEDNDYPLIGIYPKIHLITIELAILNEKLKLRQFVESLPHQRIILNPLWTQTLQNINTKVQLHSLSQTYFL